jgi:predicted RecA/RadA family phage recombinase
MAKNFVQEADILEFTAPSGGVTSGTCVKIGDILVLALETAAVGVKFRGARTGVIDHAKLSAQAWTEGAQVNWDDTNKRFTTVTTGNYRAGVAAAVAANPSSTGKLMLHGVNLGAALA